MPQYRGGKGGAQRSARRWKALSASTRRARCPFYETCHYQAQKAPAKKADVVFAAHEILFQMPKALGKNFGLVVVDEGFWQDGLTGTRLAIDQAGSRTGGVPGSRLCRQQSSTTRPTHLR